jgi:hypothetical protein
MPKIDIAKLPVDARSTYPGPFRGVVAGPERKRLGDAVGLDQFGVNLTRLKPGAASSLRHWHEKEDEFVYILEGEVVLIEDNGETVLAAIEAAAEATSADDTLVLFYSGHGVDGAALGQSETGWALTTPMTRVTDLKGTAVAWSSIATALAKSRGSVVVILDACHAGDAGNAELATNDDMIKVLTRKRAPIVVLAAAKGRQLSYEDSQLGGGVFTSFLSDAILNSQEKSYGGHKGLIARLLQYTRSMRGYICVVNPHGTRTEG